MGDLPQAYSRNGKPIHSILEILGELKPLSNHRYVLDGELYMHGVPLQKINSYIKRRQEMTTFLNYVVYDIILIDEPEATFDARYSNLEYIFGNNKFSQVELCPTRIGASDPIGLLRQYKDAGYEGAILRNPTGVYACGTRSPALVKVKSCIDTEVEVVSITSSKDCWAILTCKAENGLLFSVSAPGTVQEKMDVLENRKQYIGRTVTVEYAELTAIGIPFHPVATMWRDKDGE
jgi:ATP-dependent DNA ligase